MSLFQDDPNEVTHKKPIAIINDKQHRTHTENTDYVSRQALITHVQGASWTISNYYSQLIGNQNELRGLSKGSTPIHQQYTEIRNLELKVDSPLSTSQDNQTKVFTSEGSALLYGVFIPNAGDVFIGDIGDGRDAVFTVTDSTKLNYFKDSVYRISYQLTDYLTPDRKEDLDLKTVKVLHFRREYLDYGSNPLIEDEVINYVRSIEKSYYYLLDLYFTMYYSHEYATFLVPGQATATYDPYLTNNVLDLFLTPELPNFNKVRRLNVNEDHAYKVPTLFDALIKQEDFLLREGISEVGLVNAKAFTANADFNSIRFSGISHVVYPKRLPRHVDNQVGHIKRKEITKHGFDEIPFYPDDVNVDEDNNPIDKKYTTITYPEITGHEQDPETLEITPIVVDKEVYLIHPVRIDDYYILSGAFYENKEEQSLLELQCRDVIEGKKTNRKVLYQLSEDWKNWEPLERFYYTPVLLFLMHASLKGL